MNQRSSKKEKDSCQVAKEFHQERRSHRSKAVQLEGKNLKKSKPISKFNHN